jgi:hypothetical protein
MGRKRRNVMTHSGHGSAALGCDERHNSRSKNVILFRIPDVVLGVGEAMRRREFIIFVGSTAAAWPLAGHTGGVT